MYEKCKENLVSEGKGSPTMDTARCFRSCKCMYLIRCSMLPRILTPLDIYFRIGINSTAMIGSPVHPWVHTVVHGKESYLYKTKKKKRTRRVVSRFCFRDVADVHGLFRFNNSIETQESCHVRHFLLGAVKKMVENFFFLYPSSDSLNSFYFFF